MIAPPNISSSTPVRHHTNATNIARNPAVTAAATALLTAPAAWHRLLFREGRRTEILRVGNRMVVAGLACLAVAITLTVSLIGKVVFGVVAMVVLAVVVGGVFTLLWFVVPRLLRTRPLE